LGAGEIAAFASLLRSRRTLFDWSRHMHLLAYLDPGSGSMILQILAGGVAAIAVTAKLYWTRLLKFLRIKKDDDTPAEQQADSV